MPSKRRNNGRSKTNGGRAIRSRCENCHRVVGKDKAIKRFMVKNIVEASAKKDISDAEVFENLLMPKVFQKTYYCVSCAIHSRIVRVRSRDERKIRTETKFRMTVWQ